MSYLNQPRIFFSGKFRADPSTINNTPDNFNPNANFPPNNGNQVGNNIQLYWNPNGTGQFALDCTVTGVCDQNGQAENHPLVGQPLVSEDGTNPLNSAKLVDLDPMQQNVTELWGLNILVAGEAFGNFLASAYSNAWVQVVNGRGDYAGSAVFQSVLQPTQEQMDASPHLKALLADSEQKRLSISFVLRSFNSSSHNYLINDDNLGKMNRAGVPTDVTEKLTIIKSYNQNPKGEGTPGQIPSTGYFTRLVKSLLTADEFKQYFGQITKTAAVLPYVPLTDFDFTFGQVFGVIGTCAAGEPEFMTADRMLTPPSVTVDSAAYDAYFAPFTVQPSVVTVNLGNALPSTQPASMKDSNVDVGQLGTLELCYFQDNVSLENAVSLGEIHYQDNDFYVKKSGLAMIPYNPKLTEVLACSPLGILSTTEREKKILLQEDAQGMYLRANQFVFRMNPDQPTTTEHPRGADQEVSIYVRKFGRPLPNAELQISLMPSIASAAYTNGTLGTGGSTGLVNMGLPTEALSFPAKVCTDEQGIARFNLLATDPGNPRGYMDGQIYFLQYGLTDPGTYVQSPDDLISLHVYTQQPAIENITWENFVQGVLGQYGKLYPVMSFLGLQDENSVKTNASQIYDAINRPFQDPSLMPVTRDLSQSRLVLLNPWLRRFF